jgi:biotin transport system substrate-specific component
MSERDRRIQTPKIGLICLFSALCAAGAMIALPLPFGPVPIVIQNLFVVLSGLLLGPVDGGIAVLLFLLLGALGFPVFSGGRGGLTQFLGPTGGYLFGYLLAAVISGLLARRRGRAGAIAGAIAGFSLILLCGTLGLKLLTNVSWEKALAVGTIPFLLWDGIKCALAALLAIKLGTFTDSLMKKAVHD